MPLKDHVSPKAKRIRALLKGKYGLDLNDFKAAIKGDKNKLQAIGQAAREASLSRELAPLLKEAYLDIIQGTAEYNKAISDILVQGAKSALEIDRATLSATLENQAYGHSRKELAAEFATAKNTERERHQYTLNYIQMKGYIDKFMTTVDNNARLLQQTHRPKMKQLQADEAYDLQVAKHLLEYGKEARTDLIPQKDYLPSTFSGVLTKLRAALGL